MRAIKSTSANSNAVHRIEEEKRGCSEILSKYSHLAHSLRAVLSLYQLNLTSSSVIKRLATSRSQKACETKVKVIKAKALPVQHSLIDNSKPESRSKPPDRELPYGSRLVSSIIIIIISRIEVKAERSCNFPSLIILGISPPIIPRDWAQTETPRRSEGAGSRDEKWSLSFAHYLTGQIGEGASETGESFLDKVVGWQTPPFLTFSSLQNNDRSLESFRECVL